MKKTYELELSSSLEQLEQVQNLAERISQEAPLPEELSGGFSLVLSEACTNAILHGNKLDESKKAALSVEVDDEKIIIQVTDQGEGFNPENVPNPLAEENLMKPGGRGVYLIKEYADEVVYNDKGNHVTITFRRNA